MKSGDEVITVRNCTRGDRPDTFISVKSLKSFYMLLFRDFIHSVKYLFRAPRFPPIKLQRQRKSSNSLSDLGIHHVLKKILVAERK